MNKMFKLGIGCAVAVALVASGVFAGSYHARQEKMREESSLKSKQKEASISKKEASLKKREAESLASKKAESEKQESLRQYEIQQSAPAPQEQVAPSAPVNKPKDKATKTSTEITVEFGPIKESVSELDKETKAYHDAGVINPQGDTKYSPDIESKTQSNLKKANDMAE
ncbi:glucan-binding YG repeat protein [Weissella uvarum]|uniref:hypothetical protein n=1 Tax=Weissella uvarum TaxID=1479233 RepID=UPI001960C9D4|nr:hypothetical protein [Weissella uvarum]MBM7616686.1 glucan-binding YG repeat protein [Weissella uvarum]MCM0594859.1 hypothetical protein [Weissella uvarum]